jgi:hypothetical protein
MTAQLSAPFNCAGLRELRIPVRCAVDFPLRGIAQLRTPLGGGINCAVNCAFVVEAKHRDARPCPGLSSRPFRTRTKP